MSKLIYSTSAEYRQCLRIFFKMNSETCEKNVQTDWDTETIDELSYDEEAAANVMDYIYTKTANNGLFQKIYESAAAKMISENHEIGLAIAMSYDYLSFFQPCLELFYANPDKFNDQSDEYTAIMKKLQ